jgi:hypothetical protein
MLTGVRYLTLRFATSVAGLAAMMALALLYLLEPHLYYGFLASIGILPFRYPFLDLQFILAAVDCWQRGVDVYINNSCDVLGRPFNYSPLWLRFAFLPGKEWTNLLGLCLTISFFVALAALPPPRSGKELVPRLVATLSPLTTLAVERANIDLLIFLIATAAGVLLLGPLLRRVAAHAMIVIAGLLKIYPLVLMVLTSQEQPRAFLWVNAVAATVVLTTGIYFHPELVKMASNIPGGGWFSDFFGAHYLPDVIAMKVDTAVHPRPEVLGLLKVATFGALLVVMVGWFFSMVRWRDFCIALRGLPKSEKTFLLIGAALVSGCFFAGSNIEYRGIHLLFALPGLLAMARLASDMRVRRVAILGCVLVVALTWARAFTWRGFFPQILALWIGNVPGARVVHFLWFLREVAWWQVAALFIAILIGCWSNWLKEAVVWRQLLLRHEGAQR